MKKSVLFWLPLFAGAMQAMAQSAPPLYAVSPSTPPVSSWQATYLPPAESQYNPDSWIHQRSSEGTFLLIDRKARPTDFDPIETLKTLFSESDVFTDKSFFIWADYQLISNRGKRPDLTKTVLPMVGLNYERQLVKGLGIRGSLSANWWQENRVLAETPTQQFKQLFDYQYFTIGIGPTYHLNVNRKWDPFFGFAVTYRWGRASCTCYTLNETMLSGDLFLGARYLVSDSYFLMAETGQNGTGYLKIGTGFKF